LGLHRPSGTPGYVLAAAGHKLFRRQRRVQLHQCCQRHRSWDFPAAVSALAAPWKFDFSSGKSGPDTVNIRATDVKPFDAAKPEDVNQFHLSESPRRDGAKPAEN
jgi:hypothetical protein